MSETNTSATAVPVGYSALLRNNRNYRYLWSGQVVSLLGDWFNLIASAALVATLTKSGFAVGGLFIVRMLAPFLTSPIAGIVADRYNRKNVLFWADIVRGCTVFGFLLVRDASSVWLVYVLTAVQLGISGFFFTVRTAILPDLVESRAVGTANAITSATWSAMLALGAAAGGVVAGTLGVYPAFVIDGITFFASAVFIAAITLNTAPPTRQCAREVGSAVAEYLAGLRWLCGHPDLLLVSLHKSM